MRDARPRRVDVLGSPVDAVSLADTCARIVEAVRGRNPLVIATLNVDFVMRARRDPQFRDCLWNADMVVPDGVPICWLAALQGDPLAGRVNGTQLVRECGRLSAVHQFKVGLFGGVEGAAEGAAAALRRENPGSRIEVLGAPVSLTPDDDEECVRTIRERQIDVLLVALGSPKQDYWLRRNLASTEAWVGIGVGGSFDFISGRKPRAPAWMQRAGLEWFFRLVHEPRRLARRYLIDDLPFAWLGLGSAVIRRLRRVLTR